MKKAFIKTFQYLILAIILLAILKFANPLEINIIPYIWGIIILAIILFFIYFFLEKKKNK
ncbi:hypothetical protein KM885_17395 [Oceanobacillus caeni]|uniref:hypothetical protein n=1 Tax=Oceanobacillus caeni TaxID=405946 RepID=UPI001C23BEE2|nr:hypothetical protein [Oceanobacillus caeni]MBU8792510.1 hypothetical protein [Oceanobacillus caeni]